MSPKDAPRSAEIVGEGEREERESERERFQCMSRAHLRVPRGVFMTRTRDVYLASASRLASRAVAAPTATVVRACERVRECHVT